ncbi:MAG: dihydropteroate synthase [Nitrospiraceae bacterium]|nr:dihydropteroate synthase [Nitrospiraceae bacterium]
MLNRVAALLKNSHKKTVIMGVINVTPDSFSDGGLCVDKYSALDRAMRMADEGADVIDIGGESTRPGSAPVELKEELRRTIPAIEAISRKVQIPISIDTYKAEVARQAINAGACIINDISGLRFDPAMKNVAASSKAYLIIMHIKGSPRDMQADPHYDALVPEITDYLRHGISMAAEAGVDENKIMLDPGIGFGKTLDHNLEILNRLDEFRQIGRPLVAGVSRKSFIGKLLDNAPAGQRIEGTAAAVAVSIMKGADVVRVHDVKEMAKIARVVDAIKNS